LSGGKQAEQYAAAKVALKQDPLETLKATVANRDLPALNLAEKDQTLANVVDQQRLQDTSGAESAISRDRLKEFRDQSGRWKISSKVQGIAEDVMSGGKQTSEQTVQAMEAEVARMKVGQTDTNQVLTGSNPLLASVVQHFKKSVSVVS